MSPMPWRNAVLPVAVLFLSGCGAAGGAVSGAVLNTGIALGASAISRSQGGCYAACPVGTTCNEATGYCDPLPCRGECAAFEECIEEKLVYQCVARGSRDGNIIVNPAEPPASASTSSKPRTDVPRAARLSPDAPLLTPAPSAEEKRTAEPTP
ncbi:hypothetical protein NR798_35800 [Archangium gephyra]|uniref:hypothetical protein n=1 Tax=Archangium gephyra TaxID=48 RepID=UPI0035D43504